MIWMLIFKDYSMLIVTVYLFIVPLLSFSVLGDINAYGISHEKKLAGKCPSFSDPATSDQKLSGKINKNLSLLPQNSKTKDGESKNGLFEN